MNATTYTMSVFAKKKEISFIQLQGGGAGWVGNTFANFDLENGIVGNIGSGAISSSIENYGNGWYRCSFTATKTASGGNLSIDLINSATDGRDASYNGNIGDGVYIYGAQAEDGSYATSYIPTSGSAVTRVVESTSQTVPDGVIGQTEGTLFFNADITNGFGVQLGNSSGGADYVNSIQIAFNSTGTYSNIFNGGANQFSYAGAANTGVKKVALAYKQNDFAIYIDGNQITTDNLGTIPSISGVFFNHQNLSTTGGVITDVKLYNTRLSNSELTALTQ